MQTVEVGDECPVHNPTGWHPGSLLRSIALPVDEILEAPTSPSGPKQASNGVHQPTVNEARRRRRKRHGDQRAFMRRLDFRNMESRVHPHGGWQLEPDCGWADDPLDRERAEESRCQFTRFHPQWEILG
jgi:hypothetical protein